MTNTTTAGVEMSCPAVTSAELFGNNTSREPPIMASAHTGPTMAGTTHHFAPEMSPAILYTPSGFAARRIDSAILNVNTNTNGHANSSACFQTGTGAAA